MRHVGSEENPPCREALVSQGTLCGHRERFTSADVGTFSCSKSGKSLCWDSLAGGETVELSGNLSAVPRVSVCERAHRKDPKRGGRPQMAIGSIINHFYG